MPDVAWLTKNAALIEIVLSALMAFVWLAYLQLFLTSLRRQRRSQIMISRGVGNGLDARCFVANLGHEPLYVLEIIAELAIGDRQVEAVITDRSDLSRTELNDPREAANQGPLKPGDDYDAGSFREIADKALRGEDSEPGGAFDRIGLTVVAATAASGEPVAAERRYCVDHARTGPVLRPETLQPRQIRSLIARRRLKRRLRRDLAMGRA